MKVYRKAVQKRLPRLVATLLIAAVSLVLFPVISSAQAKKPISLDGLVSAVRINGLSTAELIQQIQTRGVAFQMTPDAEAQLRSAGARPEVIEAARANYRAAPAAPVVNAGARGNRPNVPAGPPLSKNEIVTMLQA